MEGSVFRRDTGAGEKPGDWSDQANRTARVYAAAGQVRLDSAAGVLPGLMKEWRRSGKVHSRPTHDAADGQRVSVEDSYQVGSVSLRYPVDPLGPPGETINCGCQSLPWMQSWPV